MKKEDLCTGSETSKLNSCLFFSTGRLSRALGKIADETFYNTGLSPSHAMILYLINNKDGIPQKELGELIHLSPSTVTRLLEKLEGKKLVTKRSEGKNVYLQTTPQGLALQEKIIESWNQLHDHYKDILTREETAHFIEISGKLLEHLENN